MRKCEKCSYYGAAADAPQDQKDCMWKPSEEDGWEIPCRRDTEEIHERNFARWKARNAPYTDETEEEVDKGIKKLCAGCVFYNPHTIGCKIREEQWETHEPICKKRSKTCKKLEKKKK